MRGDLVKEWDQSQRFFDLEGIPENLQDKLVPFAQLLNLEQIDVMALRALLAQGLPQESGKIREYTWKLVLGFLPTCRKQWQLVLNQQEKLYSSFITEFLNPRKYEGAPLIIHQDELRWSTFAQDYTLWDQIEKDTSRTHSQLSFFSFPSRQIKVPFFTNTRRQKHKLIEGVEKGEMLDKQKSYNYDHMTRILFIFARLNPKIRYIQGMNQILAPIFYLVNHNSEYIDESACFFMFNNIISDILEIHLNDFNRKDNPIHQRIRKINNMVLAVEPHLWQKMDTLKIDPFFYCFRWITLLFSQEFELFETLRIWENIFSHHDRKQKTDFIALSLIVLSADYIKEHEYSQIMSYFRELNQHLAVEQVLSTADHLYQQYSHLDLTSLAQKNIKKLSQPKKKGIFTFFRKIF